MAQAPDTATFLIALGRQIQIRLAVYLPVSRLPRVLWLAAAGTDGEITALQAVGSAVLADPDVRDWSPAKAAKFRTDLRIAIAVVCTPDGTPAGVVVASKEDGHEWSPAEDALLDFTTRFYVRELLRCGSRPLPTRTISSAFGWPPSEAAELESGMRAAADKGELYLLYQPEVDLARDDVIAIEALTRWQHPQLGELGPDSFIALAEQSNLIQVLGAWLLEESFRDFASWQQALPDLDVVLRINVSPAQLARPGIAEQFAAALDRHGIRGRQVCVELTENVAVADQPMVADALAELKQLGVRAALDDLGSGYSSLSRLRAYDVDLVKLDRSLVDGIDADVRARAIVRGIVALAADLGVDVTAEGVETGAEVQTLVRLGCRSAQGHFFARPQTRPETLALLQRRARRRGPATVERIVDV